ncbi:hypothetical protein [Streptomyces sp. NPDC051554]|uniref:hypothetical protein n=1 Tax=Streptomyces sp. NPDC051554 TaxID=3365656 RepID=UPI0037B6D0D5
MDNVPSADADRQKQGTIVVSRAPDGGRDQFRRYKVFIDDTQIGLIGRGQTLRFDLPAGPHRLQLRIAWCSSPTLAAMVEPGEVTSFRCAPGGEPAEALSAVTEGAADYIALQQTDEPMEAPRAVRNGTTRFRLATSLGFLGGGLALIGAWIWHYTGVARAADDLVAEVSLVVILVCMVTLRIGGRKKTGSDRRA